MNVVNVIHMAAPRPKTIRPDEPHLPVLLNEVVATVGPFLGEGSICVDATLGAGGYSAGILTEAPARLIGIDRDPAALALARTRLARFGDRVTFVQGRFGALAELLASQGVGKVDAIVADLGLSSMQLDTASRGMSFRFEGPLDMRMDTTGGETALELIARVSDDELANIIFEYGEERRSRRVARCIKQALEAGELATTMDLRRAVVRAVGPARIGGVDPATRTFQALRIAVNRELEELEALIASAVQVLRPGGVLAVVSFHSLEDRIAKHTLKASPWEPLGKKPVIASEEEINRNPRSRSAKLRGAILGTAEGPAS